VPTARSQRSRPDRKLLKTVTPERVHRPLLVICWQIAGNWRFFFLRGCDRPGAGPGLGCWFGVEPPAGIEPATPSLPWIGSEALC
jgi:hypothetical protein